MSMNRTTSPLQEDANQKRRLLMERSRPGRTGVTLPSSDVPLQPMPEPAMLAKTSICRK